MLVKRGQVYKFMDRNKEAVADFQQALAVNPKMVTAYFAMADYYAELNKKEEALAVIQEGLKHAPDSAGLKRRYQELGGK
jgi:tetratricopeptide (TPR) repeat protein